MSKKIYALFQYHGDSVMSPKDYLCIKYGTPDDILTWLLRDGYLYEVYTLGQMMGSWADQPYLEEIKRLMTLDRVTVETIAGIDLQMPSCCTCRAISRGPREMRAFRDTVRALLSQPGIGTVAKGEQLDSILEELDKACQSKDGYESFVNCLPNRYL